MKDSLQKISDRMDTLLLETAQMQVAYLNSMQEGSYIRTIHGAWNPAIAEFQDRKDKLVSNAIKLD